MITAQDIREKGFEKAMFGGYDMGQVDAFLEELAADLELMQKENAVLKGKMKVLVSKIEEYRSSEDALQMAIISAQKMGVMIEKESREKGDALLNEARSEAERITRDARLEAEMQEARLSEAKRSSVQFIENMRLLCQKQLEFLGRVGEMDFVKSAAEPSAGAAEISETVRSIEETVARAASEPMVDLREIKSVVDSQMVENQPTIAFSALGDRNQITFEGID